MRTFLTIWGGQLISFIGTAMTRFALIIWAWQQTESATTVALLGFFSFLPPIIVGPFTGVLLDRLNRRLMMLTADIGAGLVTITFFILFQTDQLLIWHLYLGAFIAGSMEAIQFPAYTALTTTLLPKSSYDRVSGLRATADYGAQFAGPFLGGLLITTAGISTVMLVDMITFVVGIITLALVRIPQEKITAPHDKSAPKESYFTQLKSGFQYIQQRRGLLLLLTLFAFINLFASITYYAIMPSMLLARSGNNEWALAVVEGLLGSAGVVSGIAISIWGLPKKRIHGVLAAGGISFLVGDFLFAIGQDVTVWAIAATIAAFFIPYISGSNRTIWQVKVPPALQGRVFSVQGMAQQGLMPFGFLAGGLLADRLFEPLMASTETTTYQLFSPLIGSGQGSGMALMFIGTSICGGLLCFGGYLFPTLRNIETDLPDFDDHTLTEKM